MKINQNKFNFKIIRVYNKYNIKTEEIIIKLKLNNIKIKHIVNKFNNNKTKVSRKIIQI